MKSSYDAIKEQLRKHQSCRFYDEGVMPCGWCMRCQREKNAKLREALEMRRTEDRGCFCFRWPDEELGEHDDYCIKAEAALAAVIGKGEP